MPIETNENVMKQSETSAGRQSTSSSSAGSSVKSNKSKQTLAGEQHEKENAAEEVNVSGDDFHMVDVVADELEGEKSVSTGEQEAQPANKSPKSGSEAAQRTTLASIGPQLNQQYSTQLGDSLIDMIINLRNENQNLVKALESNNEFVKEQIDEFKRATEDAKKREAQFTADKSEHENQVRKLNRQNLALSERLKSMEAKLKDMKLAEAPNEPQVLAEQQGASEQLYPRLNDAESFANFLLSATTSQQAADATSGELNVNNDSMDKRHESSGAFNEEDLMKLCDELDKDISSFVKRDFEVCLIQQKVNILRQELCLNRLNNSEGKRQVEQLKGEIEELRQRYISGNDQNGDDDRYHHLHCGSATRVKEVAGRLGYHLGRKATRSAVKAAKYASKQAYREQKAAAVAAAAAAAATAAAVSSGAASSSNATRDQHKAPPIPGEPYLSQHHHRRQHSHHPHPHLQGLRKLKAEVVSDLMSTANKAMLTSYKMASTHVNLALDKLSEFEQSQSSYLARNRDQQAPESSGNANFRSTSRSNWMNDHLDLD